MPPESPAAAAGSQAEQITAYISRTGEEKERCREMKNPTTEHIFLVFGNLESAAHSCCSPSEHPHSVTHAHGWKEQRRLNACTRKEIRRVRLRLSVHDTLRAIPQQPRCYRDDLKIQFGKEGE